MTGTEEQAVEYVLLLMRRGMTFDEALNFVGSEFNLSTESRAQVARSIKH